MLLLWEDKLANVFTNKFTSSVGLVPAVVYEPPNTAPNTIDYATVIGCTIANITAGVVTFDLFVRDVDSTVVYLLKDAEAEPGTGQVPIGGEQKLVLLPNQALMVGANTADSVDVTVSVLEITE